VTLGSGGKIASRVAVVANAMAVQPDSLAGC
jgi:hypothetical protein